MQQSNELKIPDWVKLGIALGGITMGGFYTGKVIEKVDSMAIKIQKIETKLESTPYCQAHENTKK